MNTIRFKEWGARQEAQVTPAEARALSRLTDTLYVEWLGPNRALIGPKAGNVGLASLSRDLQIVVDPKVPIASILDLIALAYRTTRLPPTFDEAMLSRFSAIEWLAFLIIAEVEHLLEQGLLRGYVTVRKQLPFVRGRMLFEEIHRSLSKPAEQTCEFSDYLADTPENRLLRGTLEILLARRLHPEIKSRVSEALSAFREVTIIRPALAAFNELSRSRLNQHYAPALQLCQLFLQGLGVRWDGGDVEAVGFFVPMEVVFEKAVANILKAQPGLTVLHGGAYSDRFRHLLGAPALGITIKPDVVLGPRDRPIIVVDAKYANPIGEHHGRPLFSNENLYQMVTYCATLGCPGILVYPRADVDVDVTYEVAGTRVSLLTIDLGQPALAAMSGFAADIGSRVASAAADRGAMSKQLGQVLVQVG